MLSLLRSFEFMMLFSFKKDENSTSFDLKGMRGETKVPFDDDEQEMDSFTLVGAL